MKFNVTEVPTMLSASGKKRKATNTLSGTLRATKKALVTPMKNMRISKTSRNPITIVLINSLNDVRVCLL